MEHGGATHITHKVLTLRISRRRAWRYDYVYRFRIKYGHFSSYFIYFRHWRDVGTLAGAPAPGRRGRETREK